jgi:drug/metabolite transporter (DMT)-like permease
VGAGLTGGAAQIAMTRAYSLYRAAPLTALSALGIVLTHLLAIPVFGDRPTRWQMMGSLLVIGASLLLAAGREPAPAPARSNG